MGLDFEALEHETLVVFVVAVHGPIPTMLDARSGKLCAVRVSRRAEVKRLKQTCVKSSTHRGQRQVLSAALRLCRDRGAQARAKERRSP